MASLFFPPGYQILDSNGNPVSGAKVTFYDAGTTDLADTYQDVALSSAHPNPLVADASGRLDNIYVAAGQNYKIKVTNSSDVELFTEDDIPPHISNASGTVPVTSGGTGATTAANARTNLGAASASDVSTLTTNLTNATTAQSTATWEAGTGTTETTISPAKFKAGVEALESKGSGVPDAVLWEQQASGTAGGTFTAGSWVTRSLNTEYDPDSVITLASNAFTPTVDGYIEAEAPGHECGTHQTRLYNVTDSVEVRAGTIGKAPASSTQMLSTVWGIVEASKEYRIEHRCSSSKGTDGLGVSSPFTNSVFTVVKFWRAD